jgi:chemotaxis protein methyltransferase CheR
MAPEDFSVLQRLMRRRAGISVSLGKLAHVERRLSPVLRLFDLRDMIGLVRQLRLGHEALANAVTEALTVNETSFFRDPETFEKLRLTVLPRLMQARPDKRLRIWSAATAAGQEAYSLAMILSEMGLSAKGWTVEISATDLSGDAIARAEEGWYSAEEIGRGLSPSMRDAWFQPDGKDWRIRETLRRMVRFRKFNLLDSYGWLDALDIVLCRNVLMYFDRAARTSVLERMVETMAPDGVMVMGKTEHVTLPGLVMTPDGFYRPRPAPRARLSA